MKMNFGIHHHDMEAGTQEVINAEINSYMQLNSYHASLILLLLMINRYLINFRAKNPHIQETITQVLANI